MEYVDLNAGTVTVHQQLLKQRTLKREKRRTPVFGPTKSRAVPTRVIPITQDTVRLLREHKRQQAEVMMKNRPHYRDFGLVFAKDWSECRKREDAPGLPLDSSNLGGGPFARLVKAAGVRPITLHGQRHTCATLLMAAGVPVNVVSARLGHAKHVDHSGWHPRARPPRNAATGGPQSSARCSPQKVANL